MHSGACAIIRVAAGTSAAYCRATEKSRDRVNRLLQGGSFMSLQTIDDIQQAIGQLPVRRARPAGEVVLHPPHP